MKFVEIDSGITIEVPNQFQPDANVVCALAKVAITTAVEYYQLPDPSHLIFEGGIIQISVEPSPDSDSARTSINLNDKSVTVKLPKAFQANATNTFNEDLFSTVAQGVVLAEAGFREPEMFGTPQGKQALLETAAGLAVHLMQEATQGMDVKILDATNPQLL